MAKGLFDQITEEKEDIPKINKTIKNVKKYKFNFNQVVAIVTMIICIIVGIILGNIFPSCMSGGLYSTTCTSTEFNVFLTLIFWFISFIVCMLIYSVGHIINILDKISKNVAK